MVQSWRVAHKRPFGAISLLPHQVISPKGLTDLITSNERDQCTANATDLDHCRNVSNSACKLSGILSFCKLEVIF